MFKIFFSNIYKTAERYIQKMKIRMSNNLDFARKNK